MDLPMAALFLATLFSVCLDRIVYSDQRCFSQDVALQHRMCSCLSRSAGDSIGNSSQIAAAPAPSPQFDDDDLFAPSQTPDRRYGSSYEDSRGCSVHLSNTSWCLCARSVSNSSYKLQVEIPRTLAVGRMKSLFQPKSLDDKLIACSCLCPVLSNATFVAPPGADGPSLAPMQQDEDDGFAAPASPPAASAVEDPFFASNFSLCLCNCTTTTATSPAEAPAMSSGDDARSPNGSSGQRMGSNETTPPAYGSSVGGALISKKQPQPRVTITNIHKAKEKLLAYVLPIVGFSVCVFVFVTVVLWKNLLFFKSSSSVVSSFSHLENEI